MTPTLTGISRHPIKGLGTEPLDRITLLADAPMPNDRAWALLHGGATDTDDWQPRRNFLVVAEAPRLAQIRAATLRDGTVRLSHPDLADLCLDPQKDGAALIDWVRPIWPAERPAPTRLVKAPAQGMADNGKATLALLNRASLRDLSTRVGQELDPRRFRGNLLLDGLEPWQEFNWIGKTISIGSASFEITERIERCRATEANPETGARDVLTVRALHENWGHRDFGVYARVVTGGTVAIGNEVVLP